MRTAIVLALLLMGHAAPAPSSTPNPKEQEAAEALKKAGFRLYLAEGDPRLRVTRARWMGRANNAVLTAAALARLRELPHLTVLLLYGGFTVAEEAARQLAGLRGLEVLKTDAVRFRPGTLAAAVAGMTGLRYAGLEDCHLTGDDLNALSKLPELHSLDLSGGDVTDAGLERISKPGAFLKLSHLYLWDCKKVTANGVAALRKARPKLDIGYRGPAGGGGETAQ
jgi:hypothetical protein